MTSFANPFVAASKGFIDDVIMPHSTRRRVAMGLRKLRNKQLENPWKKHDNYSAVRPFDETRLCDTVCDHGRAGGDNW